MLFRSIRESSVLRPSDFERSRSANLTVWERVSAPTALPAVTTTSWMPWALTDASAPRPSAASDTGMTSFIVFPWLRLHDLQLLRTEFYGENCSEGKILRLLPRHAVARRIPDFRAAPCEIYWKAPCDFGVDDCQRRPWRMTLPDCGNSRVRSRGTYPVSMSGGSWPQRDIEPIQCGLAIERPRPATAGNRVCLAKSFARWQHGG